MDDLDARDILATEIDRLRSLSYEELRSLTRHSRQLRGVRTGNEYQVEIESFYHDGTKQNVRVMVAVDSGRLLRRPGWMKPLTGDFIVAPDGTFVGE